MTLIISMYMYVFNLYCSVLWVTEKALYEIPVLSLLLFFKTGSVSSPLTWKPESPMAYHRLVHVKRFYVVVAFSLSTRIWENIFHDSISSCPPFFFLKWRSSRTHKIHSLSRDQPEVAQQAKMTVAEHSLMSCMWARFPQRFPNYAWTVASSAHSRIRWVKDVCVFRCNLPPALFGEWPGSFTCHCSNRRWNRHWMRVSTES